MKDPRNLLIAATVLALLSACQPEAEHPDSELPESRLETIHESAVEIAPSTARVQLIAQSCAACHGTAGAQQTQIPAIAGTPASILEMQLLAFREDAMPGATVMPRLAKGYTEAELSALAAYFADIDRRAELEGTSH